MAEYHFDVQSVVVCGDIHGDFEAINGIRYTGLDELELAPMELP